MGNPINHGTDNDRNIIVQVAYDKAGRMTSLRDPNGNLTSYEYDLLNRRTKLTNPLTNEWSTAYTDLGGGGTKTILTDPNGVDTERSFDRAGRLSSITYGNPANTPDVLFAYDLFSNRTQMTEYSGAGFTTPVRETIFGYDDARRLTSVGFDNDGDTTVDETVSYAYDAGGLRTQLTLPGSKVISYTYDERGQLVSLTDWDDQTSTFGYDKVHRHVVTERENGLRSRYTHDAAGRLRLLRHTQGGLTAAHFAYEVDGRGNRTQALEVVAKDGGNGAVGYRSTVVDLSGNWTEDSVNGIQVTTDVSASLKLMFLGNEAELYIGTGSDHGMFDIYLNRSLWRTIDGYTATDNIRTISLELEGDGPHTLELRNRPLKNRLSSNFKLRVSGLLTPNVDFTLHTIQYEYDQLSRLLMADYVNDVNVNTSGEGQSLRQYAYTYDRAGNRTGSSLGSGSPTTYAYNAANQVTGDGTYTYEYNDNGSLRYQKSGMTTVREYTWNRANRLIDDGTLTHQYDGLGNRISQNDGTDTTHYLLDLQPSLANVLRATIGAADAYYIHGLRGIHAQQTMQFQGWNYPLQDGLGSVRAVDGGGITREYDPYGVSDTAPITPYDGDSIFGFTGEQTDTSELIFLRARYYNPALGTFMSLDPFEGMSDRPMSLNGYNWVEGNTPNKVDPTGRNSNYVLGTNLSSTITFNTRTCSPSSSLDSLPVGQSSCRPQRTGTRCQLFVSEVECIIETTISEMKKYCNTYWLECLLAPPDILSAVIDLLAAYYSGVEITQRANWLPQFQRGGVGERHELELYNAQGHYEWDSPALGDTQTGRDLRAAYGFRRPYFANTHHYFGYLKNAYYYTNLPGSVYDLVNEIQNLEAAVEDIEQRSQNNTLTPDHFTRYRWLFEEGLNDLYIVSEAGDMARLVHLFGVDILAAAIESEWCAENESDIWKYDSDVREFYHDFPERLWPENVERQYGQNNP